MAENKLTEMIDTSLKKIKEVVDSDTIIGNPINTPQGTTIIPVSKIMVGLATGGIDYLGKNMKEILQGAGKDGMHNNFGGGIGTGVTVLPVGFIVVNPNGDVTMLKTGDTGNTVTDTIDSIGNIMDKAPEFLAKVKDVFVKDKNSEE